MVCVFGLMYFMINVLLDNFYIKIFKVYKGCKYEVNCGMKLIGFYNVIRIIIFISKGSIEN